jgi:hypothetical protein
MSKRLEKLQHLMNTYGLTRGDIEDKFDIEVGDEKQEKFHPRVKIKKWDNEVNLSVGVIDDEEGEEVVEEKDGTIEWRKGKKKVRFYDLDKVIERKPDIDIPYPIAQPEHGAMEFDLELEEKPESNIIPFSIKTKGLRFLYQPKLTEEEKLSRKTNRPINVEGSYAVYHESKKHNKYKTGKAFHIYRPLITDANGKWIWGDLNIREEDEILEVIIPQHWLDKATFPIVVDPTFGYTTGGASEAQLDGGSYAYRRAQLYTISGTYNVTNLTAYIRGQRNISGAIYDDDGTDGYPESATLMYIELRNPNTTSLAWEDFSDTAVELSAGDWWLHLYGTTYGKGTPDCYLAYDTTTGSSAASNLDDTSTWADEPTRDYSIYATYTAGGIPEIEQEGFAFGDDDGTESGHTLDTQDTNYTGANGTKTLRTILDATDDPASKAFKLKYQKNGSGGYSDVPVGAGAGTTPVIAIERFEVDVSTNGQTHTLTNDVGDITKAFVRILNGSKKSSAGRTDSTGNLGPDDGSVGVQLTDTDTLTFYGTGVGTQKVMGEVWRYTGSVGGDYEFIVRQRGSVVVSGSSNSASLSGVSDIDAVIPMYTGFVCSEASNSNWEYATLYCYVDGSGNIVFGRNNSGTSITAYYEAVEFTGSAWSVGHATTSSQEGTSFASGASATMNTDSTGTGGSTFDVSDWETAIIMEGSMGGDTSETGISDTIVHCFPGASTTTMYFALDNTASDNDSVCYAHILQCDDLIVKRDNNQSITEGNGTYGTDLSMPTGVSGTTELAQLALEWFPGTNGEGAAHLRGAVAGQIYDDSGTYKIQHWVHRSGNDVGVRYGVADFSACTETENNEIYVSTSSNVASGGEATTARLTAPSGKTTGDFSTGRRWDDENGSDSIDIASDEYTELEWVISTQDLETDDYIEFRVYDEDDALDTYTVTPKWTIGSTGTNISINIGDSWKTADGMSINIGDSWKTATSVSINIGDTWKTVF